MVGQRGSKLEQSVVGLHWYLACGYAVHQRSKMFLIDILNRVETQGLTEETPGDLCVHIVLGLLDLNLKLNH